MVASSGGDAGQLTRSPGSSSASLAYVVTVDSAIALAQSVAAFISIFTVRRYALHGLSYRNSVRLSVRPSVRHTRGLCPHGLTYGHNFFTMW